MKVIGYGSSEGAGAQKKFLWNVECLYRGPGCKRFLRLRATDFRKKSSCGCKWRVERQIIYGLSRSSHPHYKIYQLRKNCYDKCHVNGHKNYLHYGARGIYLYEGWLPAKGEKGKENLFAFVQWCLNNGWEEGLHLDRIDNDGPYAPWNCQFITPIENIFYASIDNACMEKLATYERMHAAWTFALKMLQKTNEDFPKDFLPLVGRWKKRIEFQRRRLEKQLSNAQTPHSQKRNTY